MMFDVVMYYPNMTGVEGDLVVETVESLWCHEDGKKQRIIEVSCDGVLLADAFTHAPDPADEQILLDLVNARYS